MMQYTIFDVNGPCGISVPKDILLLGINDTWKHMSDVKRVYFTKFNSFMEFISADTDKYGLPMCGNELVLEANKMGRFNVLRNLIRAKKLQYYDFGGTTLSIIQKVMAGMEYADYGGMNVKPVIAINTNVPMSAAAMAHIQRTGLLNKENGEKQQVPGGPLVSVIITHYNRSELIKESIKSITDQTYANLEILIVDDHSSDDEFQKVESHILSLSDKRIFLYRMNKNCGPYVCKNEMILIAKGDYITMQDSDDTSHVNRIAEQVSCLNSGSVIACSVGAQRYRYKEQQVYTYCLAAVMYKKEVFKSVGFFDTVRYGADSEFNERVRMYYGGASMVSVRKDMYYAGFDSDCLTNVVPLTDKDRNDYYAACLSYLHKTERSKLHLPYPCAQRRFYTPEKMIADISGLKCELIINKSAGDGFIRVNIIIPAYDCAEYIEECLDSIKKQTYHIERIYVGVDGDNRTLEKIKSIAHLYDNLELYSAKVNTGPYMVMNSLIRMVPSDQYFITFGADDVMDCDMVELLAADCRPKICRHDGVIFIKKSLFEQIGGFMPWRCAADSEAISRISKLTAMIRTPRYFTLRQHDKQITKSKNAGMASELRQKYANAIKANMESENPTIFIEPECNKLTRVELSHKAMSSKAVTVNMATYPKRRHMFLKCMERLLSLEVIHKIRVYLNDYDKIPSDFPRDNRIVYVVGKTDVKDTGKFYWAGEYKDEYYFTVDDDLLYTEQYFIDHVKMLEKYNSNIFVTIHGKRMPQRPKNMMDIESPMYHFNSSCYTDEWVMSGGTGVMAFDNSKFKIPLDFFKYHGMCDLWIALFCQHNRIPMLCRAHTNGCVTQIKTDDTDTLWNKWTSMRQQHAEILNSVKWQMLTIDEFKNSSSDTTKKKIGIVFGVWRRPELTEYVYSYYMEMINNLGGVVDLKVFAAGSEGDKSEMMALKYGANYIETPNEPLSQKFNAAMESAREWDPDGLILIGSDDLISYELILYYDNYLKNGNIQPTGILDGYFMWKDFTGYWPGYTGERSGESLGAGRFYTRYALNKIGWRAWGDAKINCNLDAASTKRIKEAGMVVKTFKLRDIDAQLLCLQSKTKITTSLLSIRNTFEPAILNASHIDIDRVIRIMEAE